MRRYTLLLSMLLAVCSCSTVELEEQISEFPIDVTANVRSVTSEGTKATLYNAESEIRSKTLYFYGWEGDNSYMSNEPATYSSGSWSFSSSFKLKKNKSYQFFAYANLPAEGVSAPTSTKTGITYTVTDISTAQEDVLLGQESVATPASGDVNVEFSHPYASVKFKLGTIEGLNTVNGISLSGIYRSGSTSLTTSSTEDGNSVTQYTWTGLGDASGVVEATGLSVTSGDIATFVVIPQDLSSKNAVLTINYDGGSLTKSINSGSWSAGYTTTYTLGYVSGVEVVVTSTVSGRNITGLSMVNNGKSKVYIRATIAGAWFKDGQVVAPWNEEGTFSGLPGSGWSRVGDLYYYANALNANGGTPSAPLFVSYTRPDSPVTGAHLELSVLVQAIPYDVNKSCREAFEAL